MLSTTECSHPRQLLIAGAERLGLPLDGDDALLGRLLKYQELLMQWGQKINLTALREPQDIVIRHFLDSMALVRELPERSDLAEPPTLVDVGSGGGFPGVLCALFRPDLRVTLVERVGKKAAFLLTLRRELGLAYEVQATSAERLPNAGTFCVAVSRAALPLTDWLRLGARLVAKNGWVFAMTTPHEALPALPGVILDRDVPYDIGAGPRRLLSLRKN